MATLSNVTITVEKVTDPTKVKVTVKYRLTPTNVEKLAGSVFSEAIQLWGDDGLLDQLRYTYSTSGASYAVNTTTGFVQRTRIATISKATMNEDPDYDATGSEENDEIYAKVTVAYVANAPIGAAAPLPATSSVVVGYWK